ncbi:hypothetical protein [Streptomyces sp. bgisy100]|uniref:hypothetical protein n=1 Tax=Streptomyces sp. bgisy100 TaxID=3413783 RepID=UPI003D70D062
MHARTKACVTALTSAALLTLTACGGGSNSKKDDSIEGAGKSTTSADPSASPSDDGIKRPKITLPKDVHNVFEGGKTGDPKKDAVLADNERAINSIDEVITKGGSKQPGLAFYSKGRALIDAYAYIGGFAESGSTFTGTTRYYNRSVTLLKDGSATVIYCSDESKAYSKNIKTHKVTKTSPSPKDYALYNERMEKNKAGVWQSTNVSSDEGAKQCQP